MIRINFDQLAASKDIDLGQSPSCSIDAGRVQEFARATAVPQGEPAPSQPAPSEPATGDQGADSFLLLALIPKLLAQTFEVTGASAQELVAVEKVRFVSEVDIGSEVHLRALLLKARRTDQGFVLCRIGASIHAGDSDMPALVADVLLLAGNPGGEDAGGARPSAQR